MKTSDLKNIIYAAVNPIAAEREDNGSYHGNSHHLTQEITEAVVKALDKHPPEPSGEEEFLEMLLKEFYPLVQTRKLSFEKAVKDRLLLVRAKLREGRGGGKRG